MKYSIVSQCRLGPILFLIFLYLPQIADACTCAPYPDDLEKAVTMAYEKGNSYFEVDVIFLGDVTAIRNRTNGALAQHEVTFSVRNRWKGSIPDIVSVRTNDGEIACGYKFKEGNSYLVFAHWDEQQQQLATFMCDLTRSEAKAKGAIGVLDHLTNKKRSGQ